MNTLQHALIFLLVMALTVASPAIAANTQNGVSPSPVSIPAPASEQKTPLKDPVESLTDAIQSYQAGKYGEALKEIEEAKNSTGIKHLEVYQTLLPSAPGTAWSSVDYVDRILIGSVQRVYTANGQTLSITYLVDPNMVKVMSRGAAKMVSAITGASDESLIVKGQKATYEEMHLSNNLSSYKLNLYFDDVLVTVQSATIGKDTLLKFAELIDFEKLKAAE